MLCPECEEKIPSNSKECPNCGADIDISVRYSPFRVALLVMSLSLILFVAVPSIIKTLFFSEPAPTATGPVLPLEEIKKKIGDEQIIQLVHAGLKPTKGEEGQIKISWEVTVKNRSPVTVLFDTDLRFLDEEGSEVRTVYRVEDPLLGSATETLRGSFTLPVEEAERIKNMRTIVQPSDEVAEEDVR